MGIRLLGTVVVPLGATERKGVLIILGKHQKKEDDLCHYNTR